MIFCLTCWERSSLSLLFSAATRLIGSLGVVTFDITGAYGAYVVFLAFLLGLREVLFFAFSVSTGSLAYALLYTYFASSFSLLLDCKSKFLLLSALDLLPVDDPVALPLTSGEIPIVLKDSYSSTFNGSFFFKSIFGDSSSRLELEKKFSGATVLAFWNLDVDGTLY